MTTRRNYNPSALAGQDYDDADFAKYLSSSLGIQVPDNVLYTPKLNDFVQDKLRDVTRAKLRDVNNPATGKPFTQKEADKEAERRYHQGKEQIKFLRD